PVQVGGAVRSHSPYARKNVGAGSQGATMFGTVRSGRPPCRSQSSTEPGRVSPSGSRRTRVRRSIFSGISGLPQSLPLLNDQSSVTIRALDPATDARSVLLRILSLSPDQ